MRRKPAVFHLVGILRFVIVIVISKLLKRYSKAKRTRAPAYSRALRRIKGVSKGGVKRSSGPNSRVPGGDRVAVRVGVVEMGRGNDNSNRNSNRKLEMSDSTAPTKAKSREPAYSQALIQNNIDRQRVRFRESDR